MPLAGANQYLVQRNGVQVGPLFRSDPTATAPLTFTDNGAPASSNLKFYFEEAPIHVQNYSLVLNSAFTAHFTNQVLFGVNYFNQVFHDFNNSSDSKALGLFLSPSATFNGQATGTPLPGAPASARGPVAVSLAHLSDYDRRGNDQAAR